MSSDATPKPGENRPDPKQGGKSGSKSGNRAGSKSAEKMEPIETVCRRKRYYNDILYNPGQPGPVFHGAVPDDLKTSFEEM